MQKIKDFLKQYIHDIKKRNRTENIVVIIILAIVVILEFLRCSSYKMMALTKIERIIPSLYPFLLKIYKNIYVFAGNSFTQVIAFFSAFSTITFFIIGHFKEGIIGVPLEQLLDNEYDRYIIEKRKKFVLFSPILVCFYILFDFKLLAFYTGLLTLFTVIFSAFCAAIATDRKKQEKIVWDIVKKDLKKISDDINFFKSSTKNFFVVSDRYNSKTISKLVNAMSQNQNLFWAIGNDIFDFFLDESNWGYTCFADIVYYNIESTVYSLLKSISSQNNISYAFIFLEKQIQKVEEKIKTEKQNSEKQIQPSEIDIYNKANLIYESVIIGIICGTISSCIKGSEKFIENIFGDIWKSQEKTLYKLNILLYLEYLYFNKQQQIAIYWANILMISKITFYGELHNLLAEKNKRFFLIYFMLWENTEKNILNVNLNIFYNLIDDIQTIDDKNNMNSFIGGIVKGRKRRTDEKYM